MNFVEARLAKLARNEDRNAFAELVELYKDKIFHLAYRMLNNKQEAEDAVQETFLRVYTNLHQYDENHKFSIWIFRIGTNLCIDKLRRRRQTYSLDAEMSDGEGNDYYAMLPSDEDTPEKQLIVSETQDQIHRAIETMPDRYKSVVILRYMHDMSLQEISAVLGLPITQIKTRALHRCREYLRNKFEQEEQAASENVNCKEALPLIHEYLNGDLPKSETLHLKEHLIACQACHTMFKQLEKTDAMVRMLPSIQVPSTLTAQIMSGLPTDEKVK